MLCCTGDRMTNYRHYTVLRLEGLQGVALCGFPHLRLVIH